MDAENDIDLSVINKIARDSLIRNFGAIDGAKYLVVDPELIKPLDRIIRFSELKEFDVEKVYKLEEYFPKNPNDTHAQWLYIVRPNIKSLRIIAKHINDDLKSNIGIKTRRRVLFSPRKLYICEAILEEEGVYEYVSFNDLEFDLIQLENDILSMEYRDFFKNYYLHGDQTMFSSIAKTINLIETLFGTIPNVHLFGYCAKSIFSLMNVLSDKKDLPKYDAVNFKSKFGHLILIDRSVDFVTPFCTPLSYEGLLDDVYQINAGFVQVLDSKNSGSPKAIKLSNEDAIFKEIRYMHFSDVFKTVKEKIDMMKQLKDVNYLNMFYKRKRYKLRKNEVEDQR